MLRSVSHFSHFRCSSLMPIQMNTLSLFIKNVGVSGGTSARPDYHSKLRHITITSAAEEVCKIIPATEELYTTLGIHFAFGIFCGVALDRISIAFMRRHSKTRQHQESRNIAIRITTEKLLKVSGTKLALYRTNLEAPFSHKIADLIINYNALYDRFIELQDISSDDVAIKLLTLQLEAFELLEKIEAECE